MDLSQNVGKNIWMPPQIWTTIFLTLQKTDFYLVRSCYVAGLHRPLLLIGMLLNSILVLHMKHPFSTSEESITLFLVIAPREAFHKAERQKKKCPCLWSLVVQSRILSSTLRLLLGSHVSVNRAPYLQPFEFECKKINLNSKMLKKLSFL